MNPRNFEIPLPNAHRYKLERATSASSPWMLVSAQVAGTSTTATRLKCNTLYHFRVSARGDGSPYNARWGAPSGAVSAGTPCVSATAAGDDLFVGQSATLTASVTGAPGGVSYRWQHWGNGAWTNLAATSTTHSVSRPPPGVIFYRFAVNYPSGGGTAASGVLAVQWRPMRVSVSASPGFPLSASSTKRTVTLTATSTAPSGVYYQWQQDTGSGWTDLGAKTTSSTRDVSFTTRGTRKFRVVASHATASSATSEPVHVTWDEWAIVAEMIGKLSDAVATSTAYKAAQTALLKCMNGSTGGGGKASASSTTPTYESFDDILAQYATTTKAKMDGECAATSTAMFSANASTTRVELAKLKSGNTVYAALLDTPHGRLFDANVGDASRVRLDAYLIASQSQNGGAQQGAGGQTDPVPPTVQPTGLGCVPIPVPDIYKPGNVTLPLKLAVLNCLVVSTPYSFWTDQTQTDELKGRIDNHYTWLGYDSDWGCSPGWLPDSVPNQVSCLRHDVAYGSLVEFVPKSDFGEVDMAWNPRNRFLADELFSIDLACGSNTRNGKNPCERLVRSELSWKELELNIAWVGSRLVGGGFQTAFGQALRRESTGYRTGHCPREGDPSVRAVLHAVP